VEGDISVRGFSHVRVGGGGGLAAEMQGVSESDL
jgi:hypothetical protein